MGLFIAVEISEERCRAGQPCRACVEACPVNIFAGGHPALARAMTEEEDECTLCDLCLQKCPTDAIGIVKLYEPAESG